MMRGRYKDHTTNTFKKYTKWVICCDTSEVPKDEPMWVAGLFHLASHTGKRAYLIQPFELSPFLPRLITMRCLI